MIELLLVFFFTNISIILMQAFQTTIISRGKQVEIRGTFSHTQQKYVTFLKNYKQCTKDFLKQINAKLQYCGDELIISLIFFITFAVSQIYNLFSYSQNVRYQISITGCLLYSLLFMSVLNFKRQVLIQFILLLISCSLIVLSQLTTLIDAFNAAGIVFCVFSCFLGKLVNYFFEKHYADDATPKFLFQSNLLLFQFIVWKAYQISLHYANLNTFNFDSLLPTLMAISVTNSIKIYTLFDYEVFQVIKVFKQRYEHSQGEDNKNKEPVRYTVNIQVKKEHLDVNQGNTEMQLKKDQLNNEGREVLQGESISKIVQQTVVVQEKQHIADLENQQKVFQYKWRIVAFLILAASNLAFIIYIIIKKQSATTDFKSNWLWYSASFIRTTLLLVSCEYQKVLRGQIKDLLNYFLMFWNDLIWIAISVLTILLPSLLSLQNSYSFMLSMIPLTTIKIFNYLDKLVHQRLANQLYLSMVLFWLIPISFRQLGYILNKTVIICTLDIIAASYAVFVLLVWSNKDSFISLMKTVKKILFFKKDRLNIFQKLKTTKFQYSQIIQLYVFLHVIYLNWVYVYTLSNMSQFIKIIYFINYFSPVLLYLLTLINSHHYSRSIPETYKLSFSNLLIFLGSIIYIVISYNGVLSSNHSTWSLIVFLNICMFMLALEAQRLAIVYFPAYNNLLRVMVITVLFFLIYFPFIIGFVSGYLITDFSKDYLFYYSLFGFFYIWVIITTVGMVMHWILNLTQKAKKQLFIARYMQGEMKKINLKEDIEKILVISNMFELNSYKSEELLTYLKSQQHLAILVRKEKEYEYDYQLVESEQKQKKRLSIIAKPINLFDIGQLVTPPSIPKIQSNNQEVKQNPVLMFFKQKENHRIEVSAHQDINANIIQLRRMVTRKQQIGQDQKQNQKTKEYKAMVSKSEEAIAENMSNLYSFLTKPSKLVARQTFCAFLILLTRENQTLQQSNKIYNKFSPDGLMNEHKFKLFILDYVNFKYEMAHDTLSSKLRTFCCKQVIPLFSANSKQFKHSIIRKKENSNMQSIEVWLTNKLNTENIFEFNALRKRQLMKKAKLLKRTLHKKREGNIEEEAEQQAQNNQQAQEIIHRRNPTLLKEDIKQLKDKKFMKSQSIYAVLVNSLIECNLYYQKEAQNFKIKTIKFTISNLLAILTKLNDIVFVFGYSTIYLFIAYYKSNFGDTYPIYNSISYYILLIASAFLVLVYILLIVYHKSDFEKGTLGLDQKQRSLDFKNIKFYTTSVLFLLGSALSNYIMAIGLNSYICNTTTDKLYNFSDQSCYNTYQYGYMLGSLFILVVYWPLSTITFPFSTVMNRDLEIKYKAQYQILYLQFKFLINGLNTLLNPYQYQTEQLINSISKVVICSMLALLYSKMQPCSYQLLNRIQGKIYIILALLSFAGALCFFVGLFYSTIITGSILGLYLVYFIYTTIKNYSQLKNDNQQDEILQDNIKNQKLKIEIIKHTNPQELQKEEMSMQSIKGENRKILGSKGQILEKYEPGNIQVQVACHTINASQGRIKSKRKDSLRK